MKKVTIILLYLVTILFATACNNNDFAIGDLFNKSEKIEPATPQERQPVTQNPDTTNQTQEPPANNQDSINN